MEDEAIAAMWIKIVMCVLIFICSLVAFDYIEEMYMAHRNLCWHVIQLTNRKPYREWQACKKE